MIFKDSNSRLVHGFYSRRTWRLYTDDEEYIGTLILRVTVPLQNGDRQYVIFVKDGPSRPAYKFYAEDHEAAKSVARQALS